MPLRADASNRSGGVEGLLRATAIGVLLCALWYNVRPPQVVDLDTADYRTLRTALVRWTTARPVRAIHVRVTNLPSPAERDWLVALRRAGASVTWDHSDQAGSGPIPPIAIDAQPLADPHGRLLVSIAAPRRSRVTLGDDFGPIDSSFVPRGTIAFSIPWAMFEVVGEVQGETARAGAVDSLALRRVLVLARATWESKFIVRALEDEGWKVDMHLFVAPRAEVVEQDESHSRASRLAPLDTTQYSAIIVLDSGSVPPSQCEAIERYVRAGGGLIVEAPGAARCLASLLPARLGSFHPDAALLAADAPRRGLGLTSLVGLHPNAVPLERRDSTVTVAAWRVGEGRVVLAGYDDTWRWRMAAGDSGATGHRMWWTGLVSAVAYAPRIHRTRSMDEDPAPLTAMIRCLGQPTVASVNFGTRGLMSWRWLFALLLCALLAEWALRRLRGRS